MLGGDLVYSLQDAPAVLKFYFDYAREAPDELNNDVSLVRLPNDQRFMAHRGVLLRAARPGREADRAAAPDPQAGQRHVAPTPYVKLQASGDDERRSTDTATTSRPDSCRRRAPRTSRHESAIAAVDAMNLPPVQAVAMPQGGGAIARVKPGATAFAQRAAEHNIFLSAAGTIRR